MNNDLMFSSNTPEWATPQEFFDKLNDLYHFNLDVCATDENAKCEKYFTKEQDGLAQSWGGVLCLVQSALRKRHQQMGSERL